MEPYTSGALNWTDENGRVVQEYENPELLDVALENKIDLVPAMGGGAVITNEDARIKGGMFSAALRSAILDPAYYRHIVQDALAAFIQECGLPTRLDQLRSKVEITPDLLRQVADSTNLLPNGPRQLTRDEVYHIFLE